MSIWALFILGLILGVLLTLSLWSREFLHGPLDERGFGALVSRGKQLWSVVGDPNIRIDSRGGLRVMSPLRDGTPSSGYTAHAAESSRRSDKGAPAKDSPVKNGPGVGDRGLPTNQVNSSTGAIESLLHGLRTLNGWTSTTVLKSAMTSPVQTQSGGVHTQQLNSSESPSATGWTPGHPGQFIKNELNNALSNKRQTSTTLRYTRKSILNGPETLNRVQRPEIKRGREKYEPELGVNSIGAGITQTPDEEPNTAKSLKGVDTRTSRSPARLLTEPPPWVPYHEQYKFLDGLYIPSLESVRARRLRILTNSTTLLNSDVKVLAHRALPDMSQQKGVFEHENLKLHLCNAVFEAYSASFLTTRAHMISVKSESFNLTWVNCEMASFIHMRDSRAFYKNPHGSGMIMQSLDVLDFSVIHLSAFERSSRKYRTELWKTKVDQKVQWAKIDAVVMTASALESRVSPSKTLRNITYSSEAKRTVVVMPFLGGAMGAGHSELGNRFEYLKGCFWSFYEFIPNIVAGVTRQEDVKWALQLSGLPFYDIILMPTLPKSAGLPVGLTQEVKRRLLDGRYDFDYIFFTESDQILISRQLQLMYHNLQQYPHRMLLPHRLMPYSDRVITQIHKKSVDAEPNKWMQQSCCLPRQNCQERKTWAPLSHESIPVINYYGLYVPLGNVNFLTESFRGCKLGPYENDFCP